MKYLAILALFTSILLYNCSPKNTSSTQDYKSDHEVLSTNDSTKTYSFPEDWLGYWSGELKIYNSMGLKDRIPMSLDLAKTDTSGIFTWAIIYGADSTAQRRDYQLKEVDATKGHYLIDEKNGILLDCYLMHNELSSIFEVMGNTLITTYSLENGELIFSVKFFPSESVRTSGDTIIANQEIPEVRSFQQKINQVARLQKKCLVE